MLDLFEVRDLPLARAVRVAAATALDRAEGLVSGTRAVLIVDDAGHTKGVVTSRAVRLATQETPERTVGELPSLAVIEVAPTMGLVDAVRAVSGLGVGALLVTQGEGWVITREELLAFDAWGVLFAAREDRIARAAMPTLATSAA